MRNSLLFDITDERTADYLYHNISTNTDDGQQPASGKRDHRKILKPLYIIDGTRETMETYLVEIVFKTL